MASNSARTSNPSIRRTPSPLFEWAFYLMAGFSQLCSKRSQPQRSQSRPQRPQGKYLTAANSASSANLARFSQAVNNVSADRSRCSSRKSARKCQRQGKCKPGVLSLHQTCCTPLWTGCTRLIFQQIKRPLYLLTLKLKGVKTTSFFDSF